MACFSYIEGWYNPVRLHSGLGHRSPITYEADMQATMTAVTSDAPCLAWWIGLASEARDAVGGWIEGQTAQQEGKRLLGDLPRLPGGEGICGCPTAAFSIASSLRRSAPLQLSHVQAWRNGRRGRAADSFRPIPARAPACPSPVRRPSVNCGSSQPVALGMLLLADLSNPPSTPSHRTDTNLRTSPNPRAG